MIRYCIKRRKGTGVPKKLMQLQEMITNQIGFGWLLVSVLPNIIVSVVCIVICYNMAVKAKVSKGFALLGLLGVLGVIIMVVIYADKKGKMNNSGNAFRTETINSDNYKFNGGMNVCETHQHDDTYSATYDDVMDEQPKSYNLNGENVSYGRGLCPHCGAKLKKFQKFCDSCGSRV